jgi:hypothetical protein
MGGTTFIEARPQPDADEQTRNILNEALVRLRRADYKLRVLTDSQQKWVLKGYWRALDMVGRGLFCIQKRPKWVEDGL